MSTQTLDQTTDRGLIGGSPQWSTVRATGTWQGDLTAALFARDFEFRSSEPESYGGKNDAHKDASSDPSAGLDALDKLKSQISCPVDLKSLAGSM